MKPVALITGAAGLIGGYLVRTANRWAPQWDVRGISRRDGDLADPGRMRVLWDRYQPALVIHCAALSRAGACEQEPALADHINVAVTRALADLARDIPFLFLSSDQVFDGAKGWYIEIDEANPLNVYGRTKAKAERIVLENPAHTVLRVALTAGASPTGDRSFVEDMLRAARRGTVLTLFTDEFRCPIPAGPLARAIWELVGLGPPGLYHIGGQERLSRWEIGELLMRWYPELTGCVRPGSVADYDGPARPPDLSLRCDKLQRLLSFQLPGFRQWLSGPFRPGHDMWDEPSEWHRAGTDF
jgi:dTDP-4-dehydrorhamnose reductase